MCNKCGNEEEIGIYYPDHHEHFPETMPEWTISVVCVECVNKQNPSGRNTK